MDPVKNPYSPGAGTPPPALTGRDGLLIDAAITLARIHARRSARSQILNGLRGVGKTVLLLEIQKQAVREGYKAEHVEVGENASLTEILVPVLRKILLTLDLGQQVSEKVKRGLAVFKSWISGLELRVGEIGLGINAEIGSADSGNLAADLGAVLEAVAEAAADRNTAVALCLDEIQYLSEEDFGALIMALHRVAQRQLPLVLFGAGLPQVVGLAGKSKTYAERLFQFPRVGPLPETQAIEALQGPALREGASFSDEALRRVLEISEGYPYFIQTWAYEAWNESVGPVITPEDIDRATERARQELDVSFFHVRYERMTPQERRYALAMAMGGSEPQRSGDIARRMGLSVTSVAPTRNNLIRKGMIYSPAHGSNAFTTPLFHEYMLRVMKGVSPKSPKHQS